MSLAALNLPARPIGNIRIEAQRETWLRKPTFRAGFHVPQGHRYACTFRLSFTPKMDKRSNSDGNEERTHVSIDWLMTDWLMDKKTKCVDCDGTLHVKMEIHYINCGTTLERNLAMTIFAGQLYNVVILPYTIEIT